MIIISYEKMVEKDTDRVSFSNFDGTAKTVFQRGS